MIVDHELARTCLNGIAGARTWVGHGIFNHNLVKIAGLLTQPAQHPAPPQSQTDATGPSPTNEVLQVEVANVADRPARRRLGASS